MLTKEGAVLLFTSPYVVLRVSTPSKVSLAAKKATSETTDAEADCRQEVAFGQQLPRLESSFSPVSRAAVCGSY